MKILNLILTVAAVLVSSDANAYLKPAGKVNKRAVLEIGPELKSSDLDHSFRFSGLDYGLRIEVYSDVSSDEVVRLHERDEKKMEKAPMFISTVEPADFVKEELTKYIREMGIIMYADAATDRILRINVAQFDAGEQTADAKTVLRYELVDANGKVLIPSQTATGTDRSRLVRYDKVLAKSCAKAMSVIDWPAIAFQLGERKIIARADKSEPTPIHNADTPASKVSGTGETSLESTVIRWYIISSPQGADVSWRVVSSTPDVKNTNSNYVGTTPYESTESFDIRGLSMQNAGNVQIEITCERQGYLTQKKRFNLRQAIDQREISAKFNLVKEEE